MQILFSSVALMQLPSVCLATLTDIDKGLIWIYNAYDKHQNPITTYSGPTAY